ncbi:MAG: hypothetical protein HY538_00500 [Deltaproteobacteria bacterium]|nr:hypothetical protein [Deltaproteobacteria bacterium]
MKALRSILFAISVFAASISSPWAGQWGVLTELGLSQFTKLKNVDGSAFGWSIGAEYWPVERLAMEFRYLSASHEYSDPFLGSIANQTGAAILDNELDFTAFIFGVKGAFYEDENFHFWGNFSIGDYTKKIDGEIEDADLELSFSDVGIETSVGIDYILPSHISIGIAPRYTFILDDSNSQHLGLFLRFGYFFGATQ